VHRPTGHISNGNRQPRHFAEKHLSVYLRRAWAGRVRNCKPECRPSRPPLELPPTPRLQQPGVFSGQQRAVPRGGVRDTDDGRRAVVVQQQPTRHSSLVTARLSSALLTMPVELLAVQWCGPDERYRVRIATRLGVWQHEWLVVRGKSIAWRLAAVL